MIKILLKLWPALTVIVIYVIIVLIKRKKQQNPKVIEVKSSQNSAFSLQNDKFVAAIYIALILFMASLVYAALT